MYFEMSNSIVIGVTFRLIKVSIILELSV